MTCSQGPTSPNIWPPKAGTTLVISIRVVLASDGTAQTRFDTELARVDWLRERAGLVHGPPSS